MKFVNEYRDPELGKKLLERIRRESRKPIRLMEFCGGHTVAIFKHGLRQLLPDNIQMLSGPGCPVCVTATADMDKAIALGKLPDVIITSFGDMVRVPGSQSSLQKTKAEGADVRIVYSAQDAVAIARENPDKKVVFIGIGFETTAPTSIKPSPWESSPTSLSPASGTWSGSREVKPACKKPRRKAPTCASSTRRRTP